MRGLTPPLPSLIQENRKLDQMALYEIRKHNSSKTDKVEHDKEVAIAYATEKALETGESFDVYEIKHVHVAAPIKEEVFSFF